MNLVQMHQACAPILHLLDCIPQRASAAKGRRRHSLQQRAAAGASESNQPQSAHGKNAKLPLCGEVASQPVWCTREYTLGLTQLQYSRVEATCTVSSSPRGMQLMCPTSALMPCAINPFLACIPPCMELMCLTSVETCQQTIQIPSHARWAMPLPVLNPLAMTSSLSTVPLLSAPLLWSSLARLSCNMYQHRSHLSRSHIAICRLKDGGTEGYVQSLCEC